MVAADCLVLSTAEANGICYISTETLDGERNLKPKLAPQLTQQKLQELEGKAVGIEYIAPDKGIYVF